MQMITNASDTVVNKVGVQWHIIRGAEWGGPDNPTDKTYLDKRELFGIDIGAENSLLLNTP